MIVFEGEYQCPVKCDRTDPAKDEPDILNRPCVISTRGRFNMSCLPSHRRHRVTGSESNRIVEPCDRTVDNKFVLDRMAMEK
jgi:hypothetical protein